MAAQSKFLEERLGQRSKSNDIVLVKSLTTSKSEEFVEIGLEHDTSMEEIGGWIEPSRLKASPFLIIKCVSDFAAWYLGGAFNTSRADILENRPDLCLCIGPKCERTGRFPISSIALWRQFFADAETIQSISHLLLDNAEYAKSKNGQALTRKPVGFALHFDAKQGTSRDRKARCYSNEPAAWETTAHTNGRIAATI
jgi:hypothetical protein